MTKDKKIIAPSIMEAYKKAPNPLLRSTIILLILSGLIYWSFDVIKFDSINQNGVFIVKRIFMNLIIPDWDRLFSLKASGVPILMFETIMIGVLGTIIGALISVPFAFFSSRNITGKFFSIFGILSITIIRTFPVFIWGVMFVRVAGGAFAGVLAISVSSIGMISKMYIEAIEDIDRGVIEALDSTGCNALQKVRYGIIPQLSANFISVAIYRFEINVKNATILGMVGAGGIGFTLINALGSFNFGVVGACIWGILIAVFTIEYYSTKIRTKLITGE